MLIGLSLWRKNLVLSLTVFHSANYLIKVRRVLAGSAKKRYYSKYPKFRIMSENSQESHMETAYEEVKMFLYSLFLGLNYFSNSKNKKGSCQNMAMLWKMFACAYMKPKSERFQHCGIYFTNLTSPLSEKKEDSKREGNFLSRKKISDYLLVIRSHEHTSIMKFDN